MKRMFNYGIVVDEFQPLTNGLKNVIINAIFASDVAVIYVVSSPICTFSYQTVKKLLEETFRSNVLNKTFVVREIKIPINFYSDKKLTTDGKEFLRNAIKNDFVSEFSVEPSIYVHEYQTLSDRWIKLDTFSNCAELSLPKQEVTENDVMNFIILDDEDAFFKNTPEEIHKYYSSLQAVAKKKLQ